MKNKASAQYNAPKVKEAQGHGLQLVARNAPIAKRAQRQRSAATPKLNRSDEALSMIRRTRDLARAADNLQLAQTQVLFQSILGLVDVIYGAVDGTGAPLIRQGMGRPLTVRDARRLTVVEGAA